MLSHGHTGSQQLGVQCFRAPRGQLSVQKRADFGWTNVQQLREGFGIVAIARQRGLQLVHIRRQRGVHDRGRHGFFPEPMGLFKHARQVMLHLDWR